jgi:hypothetical protein
MNIEPQLLPSALVEDRLRYILDFEKDLLQFAEAKNGSLIAGCTAVFLAIFAVLAERGSLLPLWGWFYLANLLICLGLAFFLAVLSFLPQLPSKEPEKPPILPGQANLLFFGDIVRFDAISYLAALYYPALLEAEKVNWFERNLATQVIIYARILLRKYQLFDAAAWLSFSAVFTPLLTLPPYLFIRLRKRKQAQPAHPIPSPAGSA